MKDNLRPPLDLSDASHLPVTLEATTLVKARRARLLVRDVLTNVAFISRRRALLVCVLAIGLIVTALLLHFVPKTYEATARVLIVAPNTARDPSVTSIDLPSLATSSILLARVKDKLTLPLDLMQLKHNVKARVAARSSIVEIDYRDKASDRAIIVPNTIADELVSYYDSIASSGAKTTVRKLDAAMVDVQGRLRKIDDAAARQSRAHPFVQSDRPVSDSTARIDELTGERRAAAGSLAADLAARDALTKNSSIQSKTVRHEKLDNDPVYRKLASDIATNETDLAVDRTIFTEQYPVVRKLEAILKGQHRMYDAHMHMALSSPNAFSSTEAASATERQKADALVAGDEAKLNAINVDVRDADARLRDALGSGNVADRLRLQHDAAKADYLALSARRAAAVASQAEALSLGSLVVVDRAVRSETIVVGLGKTSLGLVMALLALGIALGVAYIVDAFDERLTRPDQIERLYGFPVLALIEIDS